MRRWNRDRGRRRGTRAGQGEQPGPEQALNPEGSALDREVNKEVEAAADNAGRGQREGSPDDGSTSGNRGAEHTGGAAGSQPAGRSRRGRRRKKPSEPPPPVHQPLVPAYSETEGPRAPAAVALAPGAPTGEAAELEVPTEPAPPPAPAPAAKRASKGAVVLSVGLPGSGKTTWFKRKGVTPLSSDLLRSLLFDDPTEQRHQDLVFSSLRSLLRARMIARMPANYVDATNLSPKERRHWIRMAREFGYEAHAVYFDVPLQTCMERNRKRQRVVPEDVMQRMAAKLRPPAFEEGFAKIIVVRVKQRSAAEGADTNVATAEPPTEPAPIASPVSESSEEQGIGSPAEPEHSESDGEDQENPSGTEE